MDKGIKVFQFDWIMVFLKGGGDIKSWIGFEWLGCGVWIWFR